MKLTLIAGARPNFIKIAPVINVLNRINSGSHKTQYRLVHTGQHYDEEMSQRFFEDLELPPANINLGIGSGDHGWQTGQMLIGIEQVLKDVRPDWVVVYGDTNSTLAGALAAVKLHLRLAHVEAGLRSFNRRMPEEHNRVLTDHCADLLLCPTQTAVENLRREGVTAGVHLVGDVMYDAVLQFGELARQKTTTLQGLGLTPKSYLLATIHRAENTDFSRRLKTILEAFAGLDEPVIFPLHPRTRQRMIEYGLDSLARNITFIPPVGYLDMLALELNARLILTDSGGVQKDAYFFQVPCLTLRLETEWVETIQTGWNKIVAIDPDQIALAARRAQRPNDPQPSLFGDGQAAERIIELMKSWY